LTPEALRPKDAAALLSISVKTLYASPAPYFTIGQGKRRPRRRYFRADLLAWAKGKAA